MEWFKINSRMKECVDKTQALAGLQSKIEAMARELQPQIDATETFAMNISKAIFPIFDKKIKDIQEATIKNLTEES